MKKSVKSLVVALAIVMSLFTVQSAFAETVSGVVDSISYKPNVVVVGGTAVNGIKLNYLCNQYNICLEEVEGEVSIESDEYTCMDGTIKLMATKITVGDVTVDLR